MIYCFPSGAAMRAMRVNAGLTVRELAGAVGIEPIGLARMENRDGLVGNRSARKILRYLTSINAHVRPILGYTGRVPSKPVPILWDYPCGAMTRRGTSCRLKATYASGRCKLHGGLSTGPRTEAGKERIREGQRRRRERERQAREATP